MGTKANPGRYDCYDKAEPDEPMFVLLARDKWAPFLVTLWATIRLADGEDEAVTDEAAGCALAMMRWAAAHGRSSETRSKLDWANLLRLIADNLDHPEEIN